MSSETTNAPQIDVLKIGIDIHLKEYVFVCQEDQSALKSPQRLAPDHFRQWVLKQRSRAKRIVCCYEAGCFGYGLHRFLVDNGIENLVVRPRNLDEYGSSVKTDSRDARELCGNLDRYLAGNTRALSVVRVPSEEEERQRSLSRQRETLANEQKRLQNIGTSHGRYYGVSVPSDWWKPKVFASLREELEGFLVELLAPMQEVLVVLHAKLREATAREERSAARMLPTGLGALTASVLDREIVDYNRFTNRGQVASYTGLCPSEASSGGKQRQGSINKEGNPRLRHMLIEAVWRMFHFQPDYLPIKKWSQRMVERPLGKAAKKKMAVAIARQFMVDWWRIQTGRMKPEDVGLKMSFPSAYAARAAREGRVAKIRPATSAN